MRCFTNSTPAITAIWNIPAAAAGLPIRRSRNCSGSFAPPIPGWWRRAPVATPSAIRSLTEHDDIRGEAARSTLSRLFGVLHRDPADLLAGIDQFLDLRGAVTDLQAHLIEIALMERQIGGVTVVSIGQQALMDDLARHLRQIPLAHRGFRGVRKPAVAQR